MKPNLLSVSLSCVRRKLQLKFTSCERRKLHWSVNFQTNKIHFNGFYKKDNLTNRPLDSTVVRLLTQRLICQNDHQMSIASRKHYKDIC